MTATRAVFWAGLALLWGLGIALAGWGVKVAVEARAPVLYPAGFKPILAVAREDSLRGCRVELWAAGVDR